MVADRPRPEYDAGIGIAGLDYSHNPQGWSVRETASQMVEEGVVFF
jgi:hypothetical protein